MVVAPSLRPPINWEKFFPKSGSWNREFFPFSPRNLCEDPNISFENIHGRRELKDDGDRIDMFSGRSLLVVSFRSLITRKFTFRASSLGHSISEIFQDCYRAIAQRLCEFSFIKTIKICFSKWRWYGEIGRDENDGNLFFQATYLLFHTFLRFLMSFSS
jgi:hypothetical protein